MSTARAASRGQGGEPVSVGGATPPQTRQSWVGPGGAAVTLRPTGSCRYIAEREKPETARAVIRCARAMEHSLKCLLLSLCFVLGSALKCYVCENEEDSLCEKKSCNVGQDACMNITFSKTQQVVRRCWSNSKCDVRTIEAAFNIDTGLKFVCCNTDLCNSKSGVGPGPTTHPFFLGLLSAFATLYVCWFRS